VPDKDGNTNAGEETTPGASLHAYKDDRKDDVLGGSDALERLLASRARGAQGLTCGELSVRRREFSVFAGF